MCQSLGFTASRHKKTGHLGCTCPSGEDLFGRRPRYTSAWACSVRSDVGWHNCSRTHGGPTQKATAAPAAYAPDWPAWSPLK